MIACILTSFSFNKFRTLAEKKGPSWSQKLCIWKLSSHFTKWYIYNNKYITHTHTHTHTPTNQPHTHTTHTHNNNHTHTTTHTHTLINCFLRFPSEPMQVTILGRFTPPASWKKGSNWHKQRMCSYWQVLSTSRSTVGMATFPSNLSKGQLGGNLMASLIVL